MSHNHQRSLTFNCRPDLNPIGLYDLKIEVLVY